MNTIYCFYSLNPQTIRIYFLERNGSDFVKLNYTITLFIALLQIGFSASWYQDSLISGHIISIQSVPPWQYVWRQKRQTHFLTSNKRPNTGFVLLTNFMVDTIKCIQLVQQKLFHHPYCLVIRGIVGFWAFLEAGLKSLRFQPKCWILL